MRAKITAYNYNESDGATDFSLNCYWGNNYKNVFYLCGELGRSTFEDIIETETDLTGQTERVQNTSIERYNLTVLATNPLLTFLKTIDKHDIKTIEFLNTNEVYNIKNIDIEDEGDRLTPNNLVIITFEEQPISKVSANFYEVSEKKFAYWDNNNDGTPDINGEAEYQAVTGAGFTTYQLYYEADGVTPATSGNVLISVYAQEQSGEENFIALFSGQFGDSLTDSTKWQTSQNIYNYFFSTNTIGHANGILFDKQGFSEDNGYLSDEQENRAIELIFKISIDGGPEQQTTLKRVYSIRGAFLSAGVQNAVTAAYGVTTLGKNNTEEKNTLSTIADINRPAGAANAQLTTSFSLTAVTTFSNEYLVNTAPNGEFIYSTNLTTNGGFNGSNFRGAYSQDNFTLGPDPAAPISQNLNVLNFTTGSSPYIFIFNWKYDRQTGLGGFPLLGDIPAAGDAEVLLNGVLVNNLPTIAPATLQVLGSQSITLTNTDVNTIKIYLPTTTGYEIFTQFEVQLKPLF